MLEAKTVKKINQNSKNLVSGSYSFLDLAEHKIYRKATKRKNSHYQRSLTFVKIKNFEDGEVDRGIQKLSDAGYDAEREIIDEQFTGYVVIKW